MHNVHTFLFVTFLLRSIFSIAKTTQVVGVKRCHRIYRVDLCPSFTSAWVLVECFGVQKHRLSSAGGFGDFGHHCA